MKLISMAAVLAASSLAAGCASTGSKELTAQSLFDNFVEKAYGADGMAKPASFVMKGKIVIEAFSVEAPLVVKQMAPGFMRTTAEMMGMTIDTGCNEATCWDQPPGQSPYAVTGSHLAFMRGNADFTRWENVSKNYQSLEIVPAAEGSASDEYEVRAVRKDGKEELFYFSKQTGLLVGASIMAETAQGPMNIVMDFNNYRDFDGNLVATEVIQETPMAVVKLEVESMSYEPLSAEDFTAPQGVK